MKTSREAILQSALQLFMSMNYEKVSLQMVTRMVGLSKTGIFNYYPTKQELFVAVTEKYLFSAQDPKNKYGSSDGTLSDFIEKYVQGVDRTMKEIVRLGNINKDAMPGKSANAGYFHLFQQVLFYHPEGKEKLQQLFDREYDLWRYVVRRAAESGEINKNTDVEHAVALFRKLFVGISYEMSFFGGLDVNLLKAQFDYIYGLLKK